MPEQVDAFAFIYTRAALDANKIELPEGRSMEYKSAK
jgi:hypothetical protein